MIEVQPLVLDRFLNAGGGCGVDLVTGQPVWFHLEPAGDHAKQAQRLRIAALLAAIRHPRLAPLVDYGLECRGTWVEVYGGHPLDGSPALGRGWGEGPPDWERIILEAGGLGAARPADGPVLAADEGATVCPGPIARLVLGDAVESGAPPDRIGTSRIRTIAVRLLRRAEQDQLIDVLDDGRARGPRCLTIVAPRGAGLRTLFGAFARDARLHGFVPVGGAFACQQAGGLLAIARLVGRRHVVILDDRRDGRPTASALLARLGPAEGRPHLAIAAVAGSTGAPAIRLQPLDQGALARAVLCIGWPPAEAEAAIRRATRTSGGWPGLFVRALEQELACGMSSYPPVSSRGANHVAEAPNRAAPPAPPLLAGAGSATPAREDSVWRDDAELRRARDLVAGGRHAAAERLLRRALGAMRRRDRPADAGRLALALGRLLHERGRLAPAADAFEHGRVCFARSNQARGEVSALLHLGAVRTDDGDFAGAESTLRTSLVVAEQSGWRDLADAARALLARCVWWRGRREEAAALVDDGAAAPAAAGEAGLAVAEDPATRGRLVPDSWWLSGALPWLPAGTAAVSIEIGARTALAARDPARALRSARTTPAAPPLMDPQTELVQRAVGVLVAGAIGETARAAHELADGLREARRRHLPLMAMELRASFAEGALEAGDERTAAQACARFDRLGPRLPGLIRLRLADLRAQLAQRADGTAPASVDDRIDTATVLEVLRRCHDADDDRAALSGVCQVLRSRLEASAVTVYLGGPHGYRAEATAGSRPCRVEMVERCADGGVVLGPEATVAGIEAATPVAHGGQMVGGLAVRWPADARPDGGRVRGVLAAAAAAIGPAARALEQPGQDAEGEGPLGDLSGASAVMTDLRREILRAAAAPFSVLIQGESGTGKELIARAIHRASARGARRCCTLNCAALSDDLFESELFGHARGAFTGASADRPGLFEAADGGTLFLDEVGELTPRAQAKLLRAIQEGEIRRIGENHSRRIDTRIVAATNRALAAAVEAGHFRQDLLFRLDVLRIVVPPLRERPEDIAPLAHRFWREALARTGGRAALAPSTVAALARYHWPGNVRELQNVMAALAVQAPRGGRVGPARLPAAIAGAGATSPAPASLADARRQFDARFVRATLARAGGRRAEAAAAMGLTRQGLAKLMTRLGIAGEARAAGY